MATVGGPAPGLVKVGSDDPCTAVLKTPIVMVAEELALHRDLCESANESPSAFAVLVRRDDNAGFRGGGPMKTQRRLNAIVGWCIHLESDRGVRDE